MFRIFMLVFTLGFVSCVHDNSKESVSDSNHAILFNAEKWQTKESGDYPFREQMVEDVLYGQTIRNMSRSEILDILGEPDRMQEDHFYYTISQKRMGAWPISTKTLVIKMTKEGSVEWIKLHG